MHPLYRQLAPAPPGETPGPSGNVPQEKKKKKARMACNYCRQKRVRCDQGRPICNRCVHLGLPCAYMSDDAGATPTMALKNENEILQRRLRGHIEYLEAIRNASEDEAFDIIRRLRSTDVATALALHSQSQVSAISQSFEVPSTRMVTSSADSEFDLDLDSTSYSDLMSPNLSLKAPTSLDRKPSSPTKIPISSPEHIALCDTRLQGLAVKYWTQIPIDDRLAAQAISHLLISEHPVVGFLDVNLFLNDVVNQALYYCSSFLFHAVMALACQSYSVVVFSIASFTTAFVDEALKMWPNERSTDSRSTLAALNCLSVATGWDGRDKLQNDRLLEDARAMAIRLQMLDVASTTASMDQFQSISEDDMGSHAWGDFGWHS